MLALVLTCDRYHPFTENMLRAYADLWPDHPFTFRVPFQTIRPALSGPAIELIQTPEPIRDTVLSLIDGLPDDQWVYWAIDDKYPIGLDVALAARAIAWATTEAPPNTAGVSFALARRLFKTKHLVTRRRVTTTDHLDLVARRDFVNFWLHQLFRVRVIRRIFESFPDRPFAAKEMEDWIDAARLPRAERHYVTTTAAIAFAESTTRGRVTANCAQSLESRGIPLPEGFAIDDQSIEIGAVGQRLDLPQMTPIQRVLNRVVP